MVRLVPNLSVFIWACCVMSTVCRAQNSPPTDEAGMASVAVQALVVSLHDDDEMIRVASARSLVQIGEPAIPEVIKVLSSDDQTARTLAAQILGNLRVQSAVPALSRVIQDKGNEQHVRLNAIWAIGSIFSASRGFGGGFAGREIQLPGSGGGF